MSSESEFVRFVRREMERLGYNQAGLATRAGISKPTVSLMLTGKRTPDVLTCQKLAVALQCDPKYLQQLAGHSVPANDEQTLELSLRKAITPYLTTKASSSVIDAIVAECIRTIQQEGFRYNILLDADLKQAHTRLENLDLDFRAIDPLNHKVLTAFFQGDQVFYVTGELNERGDEIARSPILGTLIEGDTWSKLQFKYRLQVWPRARCIPDNEDSLLFRNPYIIHFWIPAGFEGQEAAWQFRVVFPDGTADTIRDNLVRAVRERQAEETNDELARILAEKEEAKRRQKELLEAVEGTILSGQQFRKPVMIGVNPNTLSYLMLLAQVPEEDENEKKWYRRERGKEEEPRWYWILEGTLNEIEEPRWSPEMSERVQLRYTSEHGHWRDLFLFGGYCLTITATETTHTIPTWRVSRVHGHRVMSWEDGNERFAGVPDGMFGTWRVWQIQWEGQEFKGLVLKEQEVVTEPSDQRHSRIRDIARVKEKELERRGIPYTVR